MNVAQRYAQLREEVARVARACGRDPDEIQILAVTKSQPASAIEEALSAGISDIGENYVQEARTKFASLCHREESNDLEPFDSAQDRLESKGARKALAPSIALRASQGPSIPQDDIKKHFIGHIQTNKANAIAELFDVVQSVDRLEAAQALGKAAHKLGKSLRVLIQLNISPSERHGCPPEKAAELATFVRSLKNLQLDGVMAIGPLTGDRSVIENSFATAAAVFKTIGGGTLSLGMSEDWPLAVAAGSTMIRLGTALFGPRTRPRPSKENLP